jgi:glycerol-3-phosphate O-acyltransferase / dihydroxyacetone phosphate acyltransferase
MPGRGPVAYRILRGLARLLLTLFYRRIEVVGREHIPPDGPAVITANHHNALVDPMLVMAAVPRPLVILAAAPLFTYPVIGSLLRLVGALPVLRRQEGIAERSRNDATFGAVATALERNGAVLLFPEGRTQPEPVLLPLRTGAARMLLGAAAEGLPVTLVPVGLVFHEPGTFRGGHALVLVGAPVPIDDLIARHGAEPERAVRELTARLTGALRARIVEADDRETLRLMRLVESIWPADRASATAAESARVSGLQEVARAYRVLLERAPERLRAFRHDLERYAQDLELSGLAPRGVSGSYPPRVVLWWAVREALPLVASLPLAFCGIAIHGIPYQLTARVVRALHPPDEEEATFKILAGAVFYPLCWIAEGVAAWKLGGGWALAALIVAILPTGFFALAWQERVGRARRDALAFLRFLADRDLRRSLVERRQALVDELLALARLAGVEEAPGPSPRESAP